MRQRLGFAMTLATIALVSPLRGQEADRPTKQHERLDALTGDWDVAITFKVGPDAFREGTATCSSRWILDGHAVQQEYRSQLNGKPFTVMQWVGYDPGRKKFFEMKLDNMDPGVLFNEGTLSDDGRVLTQSGDRVDPATGQAARLRTVTTFVDPDHYTLEWFMPGEGGREEKAVTLKHTRKKE